MAAPTTSTFGQYLIKLGDGATPTEAFTIICGLTSKGFDINNNTASTPVPDCADEDAPVYEEMSVSSQTVSIKGSGVFPRELQKDLLTWAMGGTKRNVRVHPGQSIATDVDYYSGPAILKTFGNAVARGEKVQMSLEIVFASKPVATLKP